MTTETNAERLAEIQYWHYEADLPGKPTILSVDEISFLIQQAEHADRLQTDLRVVNKSLWTTLEENIRLRKALEFYADRETYTDDRQHTSTGELVHTGYTKIQCDTGNEARTALNTQEDSQ